MKTKHTPGPWEVRYESAGSPFAAIVSPQRRRETDANHAVCEMRVADPEHAANAALVAAAPQLLESLQALVSTLEAAWAEKQLTAPRFVQCQLGTEVKHAIAAIAKANGRA